MRIKLCALMLTTCFLCAPLSAQSLGCDEREDNLTLLETQIDMTANAIMGFYALHGDNPSNWTSGERAQHDNLVNIIDSQTAQYEQNADAYESICGF